MANPAGYGYYRMISALTNLVSWVDLTVLNFDFNLAKSDGSDLLVYDATVDAAVPAWLASFDATAQTGRIWLKASNITHEHRLYYGNSSASSSSSFTDVFTSGTGFDADFGTLSTSVAGVGAATRLPASTGLTDNRGIRIFKRSTVPAVGTGQWANRPCVREFSILTDPYGKIVQDGGVYVAYYVAQETSGTHPGQTYRCTSTDLVTWSNHALVMAFGPGTFDDLAARVATAQKWDTGDYRLWYTCSGSGSGTSGIALATSTDGITWTKPAGAFMTYTTTGITDMVSPVLSGVPDVIRLLDGTYRLHCEVRDGSGVGYPWRVYGWRSNDAVTWTVLNGGANLLAASNGLTTWGAANAHFWQRGAGDYFIFAQGFSGSSADLTTFNGNVAFWHATSTDGPYTLVNEAVAGRINVTPSNFGTEAGGLAFLADGSPVLHIQDYPAADNLNTLSNVYRVYPVTGRMGVFNTGAAADAAIASAVIPAGNFTLENHGNITTHRSGDNNIYQVGLADSAAALTVDTSTNNLAKFRVAIRQTCFSGNQATSPNGILPGAISFLYWDASAAIHYYKGATSSWTTTITDVANTSTVDTLRSVVFRIDDDGTNFVLSARYSDDNTLIASALIAKSSVKAFSSGRVQFSGVPFTNTNYGGAYSHRISLRPYTASDPAIVLGGMVSTGVVVPPPPVILPGGSLRNSVRRTADTGPSISVVRRRRSARLD